DGRLWREAQTMAKLSPPSVVAVYDVGTVGDRLFLAMEFVDGLPLSEWLLAEPRSWQEVLDVFLQAGEGLTAAHAAGIVHRDFKPDNVLVGFEGQVKVTDFGLPRWGGAPAASADRPAIGGTPAYMAPEQARGEPADARSDQFSFAVSLFEALEGARPSAVAPAARRAPARIHRVLSRAL